MEDASDQAAGSNPAAGSSEPLTTSTKPEGCYDESCLTCDGWLSLEGGARPCPEKRFSRLELWRRELPAHFRKLLDEPFIEDGTPEQRRIIKRLLKRLDRARGYWADPKHRGVGIGLFGKVGSGKTHLAIKFALAYYEATGIPVMATTESEYLASFSASRGGHEGLGAEMYSSARDARALLLDDLGASRYTEARIADLSDLIADLHRRGVMLIWTANLPIQDADGVKGLESRGIIDERVASRLSEMCVTISTAGLPDWRLKNQEALLSDFAGGKR